MFTQQMTKRSLFTAFLSLATILTVHIDAISAQASDTPASASQWVVGPDAARQLISEGAIVLDTRGDDLKKSQPLAGAQPVVWQDFTNPDLPNKGQLLSDDAVLTSKLQALGISKDKPVLAVADSKNGWGEDGRIVWTLRTLGHDKAFLVNGGIAALTDGGSPTIAAAATPGDFVVARTDAFEIKKEELVTKIGAPGVVILDTREPREYAGETPYGETRGGHVPGAKHIFYKDLVGEDGNILPPGALKARLDQLGVAADSEIVSYCTGGIRSGFVTAVLNNAGIKARNYAGSMWEWSASPAEQYPLVTE